MPATPPASDTISQPGTEAPLPWWRFKIVWLVFGLPATVVVASLVTGGIAWTHVDPIVTDTRPAHANAARQFCLFFTRDQRIHADVTQILIQRAFFIP